MRRGSEVSGGGGGRPLLLRPPFCCCGSWARARQNRPGGATLLGVRFFAWRRVSVQSRGGRGVGAFQARSDWRHPGTPGSPRTPGRPPLRLGFACPDLGLCSAFPGPAPYVRRPPEQAGGGGGCCGPGAERKVAWPSKRASRCAKRPFLGRKAVRRAEASRTEESSHRPGPPPQSPGPTPCPPPGSTPLIAQPGTWDRCLARRRRPGSRASATVCS